MASPVQFLVRRDVPRGKRCLRGIDLFHSGVPACLCVCVCAPEANRSGRSLDGLEFK